MRTIGSYAFRIFGCFVAFDRGEFLSRHRARIILFSRKDENCFSLYLLSIFFSVVEKRGNCCCMFFFVNLLLGLWVANKG